MHLAAHLLRAAGTTLAAALLAVLLAVAQAVVQAGPAAAVEAQGLRVDPVEDTVLGSGSELRPALIAGGSVTYPLRLRNTRDVAVEALVYGADVMDGEVASGADNSGVGSWITTDEQVIELGPETALVIEVTVTRPEDDVDGGDGAIVVQLSESSRQDLGLDVLQRAALPVTVAADGSGDGTPVTIESTTTSRGLVPGDVTVEVVVTNPGDAPAAPDTTLVVGRPLGDDARLPVEVGTVAPGASVTTTVVVEMPWWGLVGPVRAEAASVGLTSSSTPTHVTVVPGWAALLLIVVAAVATARARRQPEPFELGRVPGAGAGAPAGAPGADGAEPAGGPGADGGEPAGGPGADGDEPAAAPGSDGDRGDRRGGPPDDDGDLNDGDGGGDHDDASLDDLPDQAGTDHDADETD